MAYALVMTRKYGIMGDIVHRPPLIPSIQIVTGIPAAPFAKYPFLIDIHFNKTVNILYWRVEEDYTVISTTIREKDLKHMISDIARSFSLDLIFVFGSQKDKGLSILRGETVSLTDPLADLDIGVVFSREHFPEKPYKVYGPMYVELEEIFHPLTIDLVFLEETESTFQFEAIKGSCIFSKDRETLENYVERVLTCAADWNYFRERINEEFMMRS